ncbi:MULTISPECIES: hypothetical protein [unclassified Lysobacter]
MNRKLHNTLPALTASAALLVSGLIAMAPVMQPEASENATSTPDPAVTVQTDGDASRTSTTESNHLRMFAMPYFSFIPRG